MNSSNEKFIAKLRSNLSTSLDEIDEKTVQQLRHARAQAVHTATIKREAKTRRFSHWLSPTSAAVSFASISIITIVLWFMPQSTTPTKPFNIVEDIALLSAPEELEFYEDLDFYIWLDHEESPT